MKRRENACESCKYYDYDHSTGTSECLNDDIDEDNFDEHFVEDKPNCPFYEEKIVDCEYEESYVNSLKEHSLTTISTPYKYKFTVNNNSLYSLCNKYRWYTCGSNEDYESLFIYCTECNYDKKEIDLMDCVYTISNDIVELSEMSEDSFKDKEEFLKFVIRIIFKECVSVSFKED